MLLLVSAIKLIAEIALLALAGQFLLGLLAGAKREQNFFYQILQILTRPFTRLVRFITPAAAVLDKHIPLATFVLLFSVWLAALFAKLDLCVQGGRVIPQCL